MNTYSKKDPFISQEDHELDQLFSRDILGYTKKELSSLESTLPSANVDETEKDYTIELAIPGMKKEDLNVELRRNVLTISSEKRNEKEEKDDVKNYVRKEFSYQSFKRSFTLPDSADENSVKASYHDGILHIEVGKKMVEAPNQPKTIEVQ
jgi:HSP20 family protein